MSDISELIESAQRLEFRADVGDMGRKPDPTCSLRIAAKCLRKADETITRLRAELAEARPKAFEEAAKVAEGEKCSDAIVAAENIAGSGDAWLVNHICDEIAQAIRAMIDKEATMEGVGG